MKIHVAFLSLLAVASAAAPADAPAPARAQMDGFIAALNSGDRSKIEAFGREHMPPDFMRPVIIDQTLAPDRITTIGLTGREETVKGAPH
jgi:hypothetical protein